MNGVLLTALLIAGPWTTIADEGGVKVQIREAGRGHTVVRGTTELPYPAAKVEAVLRDLEGFKKWVPSLHTWTVVERKADSAVVYARHELPWPMDDRDYRVEYRWRTVKGRFSLQARSTQAAGPAPIDGIVRLKDVRSIWTLEPIGSDRVRVTYKYHGDLGGDLPEAVVRSTWEKEPRVLFEALTVAVDKRKRKSAP